MKYFIIILLLVGLVGCEEKAKIYLGNNPYSDSFLCDIKFVDGTEADVIDSLRRQGKTILIDNPTVPIETVEVIRENTDESILEVHGALICDNEKVVRVVGIEEYQDERIAELEKRIEKLEGKLPLYISDTLLCHFKIRNDSLWIWELK